MSDNAVIGLVAAGVIFAAVGGAAYASSGQDMTCTVTDKDRTTKVVDGNSSTDVRIWTEDCGVLKMDDSLIGMSFDTADKYGQIKVGQTYDFHTFGWRVPVFSMFPNITKVAPANTL